MAFNAAVALDAALTAYSANAEYETDASGAKVRAFIAACRQLRALLPQASITRGTSATFAIEEYRKSEERATGWASARNLLNGSASGGFVYSVEGFRD